MAWVSAPNIEDAPLEPAWRRFSFAGLARLLHAIEQFLEVERAQLPLWFVASFGAGIAAWLWLPAPPQWAAFIALPLGPAAGGMAIGERRLGRAAVLADRWRRCPNC